MSWASLSSFGSTFPVFDTQKSIDNYEQEIVNFMEHCRSVTGVISVKLILAAEYRLIEIIPENEDSKRKVIDQLVREGKIFEIKMQYYHRGMLVIFEGVNTV